MPVAWHSISLGRSWRLTTIHAARRLPQQRRPVGAAQRCLKRQADGQQLPVLSAQCVKFQSDRQTTGGLTGWQNQARHACTASQGDVAPDRDSERNLLYADLGFNSVRQLRWETHDHGMCKHQNIVLAVPIADGSLQLIAPGQRCLISLTTGSARWQRSSLDVCFHRRADLRKHCLEGQAGPLLLQVPRDPPGQFADQDRPSNVRSRSHNIGGGDLHQRRAGLMELAECFSV